MGIDVKTQKEELLAFKNDFDKISKAPDRFNEFFGDLDWIAYESLNSV